MAKLSLAQVKALNEIHELGYTTARKNTLDSVAKYCTADGEKLKLNTDGREIMGITETTTVDDVLMELDSNPWDNVTEHASIAELNGEADKPFVVQQLIGNIWTRVGRVAATWGTANVWRNRMAAKGLMVRVHNVITDQVWA